MGIEGTPTILDLQWIVNTFLAENRLTGHASPLHAKWQDLLVGALSDLLAAQQLFRPICKHDQLYQILQQSWTVLGLQEF